LLISWNFPLVILLVVIAFIGSHTALIHARRMRVKHGKPLPHGDFEALLASNRAKYRAL